jgi:transcriptional regulator with XRE-family HTH domain
VNTIEYQQVLGRRIAQGRRRHGLSQPEFAALLDQPVAWVSQLERGIQPVDCPAVLQTVADALQLPLAELTAAGPVASRPAEHPASPAPQRTQAQPPSRLPERSRPPDRSAGPPRRARPGRAGPRPGGAEGLRVLLAGAHALGAMLGEQSAPSVAWLRAATDRACALARTDRVGDLTDVLADLLPGLEVAVRQVPPAEQPDVYELMAVAYQICAAALARLGEAEAAWVATDRAMAAAEGAGNLLLVAAGAHRLASVFLGAQRYGLAEETARTTIAALQGLAELGDPDAVALCGGLTLLRAVVAARAGRQGAAYGQLTRARHLAAQLGQQRAGGVPEFSAECVAMYEIAVSADLGDAGHALRVAATIDTTGLTPGQQARMLINVARAFTLREQVEEATDALARAEAIGAAHVRNSDRAREVIADLLELHDPPPTALADLQARLVGSASG